MKRSLCLLALVASTAACSTSTDRSTPSSEQADDALADPQIDVKSAAEIEEEAHKSISEQNADAEFEKLLDEIEGGG